ncbi:MAG: GNAT family N-acetyltransferase, partial [Pseudoflavonifractor sp.]
MPEIRLARPEDLDAIWSLVTRAVRDMQRRGNPQWDEFYPTRTHYVGDQACGELYVCTDDGGRILGAVCINTDQAPEYASLPWTIPGPAVVLHRMAVDPAAQCRGI